MQRYKIIHRTYYNYSEDVTLGPHTLLLRPREDHELRIESFILKTTPPANLLWHRDVREIQSPLLLSIYRLTNLSLRVKL